MSTETMQELHHRTNDGIDVRLLWDGGDRLVVTVDDARSGDAFTVDVGEGDNPLEVFRHPFAYAAWRRVDTSGTAALAA